MKHLVRLALIPLMIVSMGAAHAGSFTSTIAIFKNAGASGTFFGNSYAYAVFPTVGAGALGVGGAYGKGRVYVHGVYTGDATIGQVSVGRQSLQPNHLLPR
jgi:hypothetical protein